MSHKVNEKWCLHGSFNSVCAHHTETVILQSEENGACLITQKILRILQS